jgi:hypothetical protein
MNSFQNLKEEELASMAAQIEALAAKKSENDLYMALGNALYDSGIVLDENGDVSLDAFDYFDTNKQKLNLSKSFDFVSDSTPLDKEESKANGKKFWERFKDELRKYICEHAKIKELFEGKGTLRDYLKVAIPLILSALGWAAMGPLGLTILASVAALIGKVGFAAYCNF